MPRATASKVFFNLVVVILLAFVPGAVFAQHGGGHGGGGGFHGGGGGGFRGGGVRGGGSSGAGRAAGGSSVRSYGPAPSTPRYSGGSSSARPNQNPYRPGTGNSGSVYAGGRSGGRASAPSDGQWHPFGSQSSATPNGTGNSFAAGTSRAASPAGAPSARAVTRSFEGQGNEIRETTSRAAVSAAMQPSARIAGTGRANTVSASRLNSFEFGGSALAGSRVGNASNIMGRPVFGGTHVGGLGSFGVVGPFRGGRRRFGFGFRLFPAFRPFFGFGLGFGSGWNSCWGVGWGWDPFCFDSFSAWPPYTYAYPSSVGYDPDYVSYQPDYDAVPEPSLSVRSNSNPVNSNWDTGANAPSSSAASAQNVIIYLKDGTSFSPGDYWLADKQLHYLLGGAENAVDIERVDLPRTNDENYQSGVKFWLKSERNPSPSGTEPTAAPNKRDNEAQPTNGKGNHGNS